MYWSHKFVASISQNQYPAIKFLRLSSIKQKMEVTIHKFNNPVLLHATYKICRKIYVYFKMWNTAVNYGTSWFKNLIRGCSEFCYKLVVRTSEMCSTVVVALIFLKVPHYATHGLFPWSGLWRNSPMSSDRQYVKITSKDLIILVHLGVCEMNPNKKVGNNYKAAVPLSCRG